MLKNNSSNVYLFHIDVNWDLIIVNHDAGHPLRIFIFGLIFSYCVGIESKVHFVAHFGFLTTWNPHGLWLVSHGFLSQLSSHWFLLFTAWNLIRVSSGWWCVFRAAHSEWPGKSLLHWWWALLHKVSESFANVGGTTLRSLSLESAFKLRKLFLL